MIRHFLGRAIATYYRARTRGRLKGTNFLMTRTSLLRVRRGGRVIIGKDVVIGPEARIVAEGATLVIGDGTFIGKNATLVAFADLTIGSQTLLGENVSIHTENHGPAGRRGDFTHAPVMIGSEVWLGAGVVVTAGVNIGDDCTVGANAVVTKSLSSGVTAVGVPARVIRDAADSRS